jgi:hypothetical protein
LFPHGTVISTVPEIRGGMPPPSEIRTADERKVLQEMEAAWTKVAEEVEGEPGKNGI